MDPVETILGLCGQTQPCPVIRGDRNSYAENDRQWMDGAKVKRILGQGLKIVVKGGPQRTLTWYKRYFAWQESALA